ncbi:hypothetical protein D3C76_1351500 [compost metagenome]
MSRVSSQATTTTNSTAIEPTRMLSSRESSYTPLMVVVMSRAALSLMLRSSKACLLTASSATRVSPLRRDMTRSSSPLCRAAISCSWEVKY